MYQNSNINKSLIPFSFEYRTTLLSKGILKLAFGVVDLQLHIYVLRVARINKIIFCTFKWNNQFINLSSINVSPPLLSRTASTCRNQIFTVIWPAPLRCWGLSGKLNVKRLGGLLPHWSAQIKPININEFVVMVYFLFFFLWRNADWTLFICFCTKNTRE